MVGSPVGGCSLRRSCTLSVASGHVRRSTRRCLAQLRLGLIPCHECVELCHFHCAASICVNEAKQSHKARLRHHLRCQMRVPPHRAPKLVPAEVTGLVRVVQPKQFAPVHTALGVGCCRELPAKLLDMRDVPPKRARSGPSSTQRAASLRCLRCCDTKVIRGLLAKALATFAVAEVRGDVAFRSHYFLPWPPLRRVRPERCIHPPQELARRDGAVAVGIHEAEHLQQRAVRHHVARDVGVSPHRRAKLLEAQVSGPVDVVVVEQPAPVHTSHCVRGRSQPTPQPSHNLRVPVQRGHRTQGPRCRRRFLDLGCDCGHRRQGLQVIHCVNESTKVGHAVLQLR